MPVLFVISGEEVSIVGIELTEDIKEEWHMLLPALLHRLNATGYIMVMEAWRTIDLAKDSPLVRRLQSGEVRISQLPADDKEEIVGMFVVDNGKSCQCWNAKIGRTTHGRFITGWEKLSEDMEMVGRMVIREW